MRNPAELLQQTEDLLNRGEIAQALGVIAQVKQQCVQDSAEDVPAADRPQSEPKLRTLPERIQDQRDALFGVTAMVGVLSDAIDPDKDYDKYRVLNESYDRLDAIATALDEIGCDVRRAVHVISDALLVTP